MAKIKSKERALEYSKDFKVKVVKLTHVAGIQITQQTDKQWAGDFTYIKTKTGWLYHAIVMDLYSRKGNPLDNATVESFFHTMKAELVHHRLQLRYNER